MKEFVVLEISSFRFAIGGEHFYGRLDVREKEEIEVHADGRKSRILRFSPDDVRHPSDGFDVQRVIDSKEAIYLNKKDNGCGPVISRLKAGDKVSRFNDRETVVEAAKNIFPELFDESDILALETRRASGIFKLIVAPENIMSCLTDLDCEVEYDFLDEHGYLTK